MIQKKNETYYHSGCITFRKRSIGIVFSGQSAEHIMKNFLTDPKSHPITHIRIQQLAKQIKDWDKSGDKRYFGTITDNKNGVRYRIVTEIYPTFAVIITCFKY